jgi:hypothetical protein
VGGTAPAPAAGDGAHLSKPPRSAALALRERVAEPRGALGAARLRVGEVTLHDTRPTWYYYYRCLHRFEVIGAPIVEVRFTLVRAHAREAVPTVIARDRALGAAYATNPASVGRFVYQNLDDPEQVLNVSWWAAPGAEQAAGSRIVDRADPEL